MSVESHDLGPVPNLTQLAGYGDSYVVPGDEVYVVAEDTDYIYLNTGSNPPADGFNIIKAIFLPGVWQRRSSVGGSGALRFNTVAVGALGSGRLIDVAMAGLVDGTSLAWVESVKDTWRWDATSTLTADNITVCNPTANGANPGRFIRELEPAPEWMLQTTWVVDAANSSALANDENDGLTATTPLLTDTERQRRMGPNPDWSKATEYHLRYISDVPTTQPIVIAKKGGTTQLFVHGSMTDGAGQSTLFSGTSGTITALNYAAAGGGQPWEMICATIPASWTASGLVNKRLRFTSGANIRGVLWIIKDLGGAAPDAHARLSEPQVFFNQTAPLVVSANTFTPAPGDTFVVENLTTLGRVVLDVESPNGIMFDSVNLTIVSGVCSAVINIWGSFRQASFSTGIIYLLNEFGNQTGAIDSRTANIVFSNCYSTVNGIWAAPQMTFTRHMNQGGAMTLIADRTPVASSLSLLNIQQIGAWDCPTYPILVSTAARFQSSTTLWGNGQQVANPTLTAVQLSRNAAIGFAGQSTAIPNSFFYMLTANAGVNNGAFFTLDVNADSSTRCFVPAFDYLATQTYTAPRLLSAANMQTTVALGGFGGIFNDPVTGCSCGNG